MNNLKYLNIGSDTIVFDEDIIGVFDLDKVTVFKSNRIYLSNMQKRGKIVNTTENLPKSFIVLKDGKDDKIYLSQLLPSTILKRRGVKQRGEFK